MVKLTTPEAVLGFVEAEGWEKTHLANPLVVEVLMGEIPADLPPAYYVGLAAAFDYTRRKFDNDRIHQEVARYESLIAGVAVRLREALKKVATPPSGS